MMTQASKAVLRTGYRPPHVQRKLTLGQQAQSHSYQSKRQTGKFFLLINTNPKICD